MSTRSSYLNSIGNEGYTQGTQAYETRDLELIGEIARLAGRLAPFYTAYTTAENEVAPFSWSVRRWKWSDTQDVKT